MSNTKIQISSDIKSGWWFGTFGLFFHILGMSSSQLTNSMIFQRGRFLPPTRNCWLLSHHMGMYQNQSCYIWEDEHPFTSYLGFTRVPRFWLIPIWVSYDHHLPMGPRCKNLQNARAQRTPRRAKRRSMDHAGNAGDLMDTKIWLWINTY